MEKTITITEELKLANVGKLDAYEVGQEVEIDDTASFDGECHGACSGHWVKIGGLCVCNPAPEVEQQS